MLRSTGFFRGLDCPFYADYSEGKGGRNGCNRPYCHFRHSSQQRRASYGAPADVKRQQKEQGYDPFNPEVVRPEDQQNGDLSGALEQVNRAIEEARNEVEREKRKLSRMGDEPYDPGQNATSSSVVPKPVSGKRKSAPSSSSSPHMDYNPSEKSSVQKSGKRKTPPSSSHEPYDPCDSATVSKSGSAGKSKTKLSSPHLAYEPSENTVVSSSSTSSSSSSTVSGKRKKTPSQMEYDPGDSIGSVSKSGTAKSKSQTSTHEPYDPCESTSVSPSGVSASKRKPPPSQMAYNPTEKSSLSSSSAGAKSKALQSLHEPYDPCESPCVGVSKSASVKRKSPQSLSYNPSEKSSASPSVASSKRKTTTPLPSQMEYDPSENSADSSSSMVVKDKALPPPPSTHMAYDPGSYQITAVGYNPAPGCSKYTLDSDDPENNNNNNSMEYVPTSVKRPQQNRTHAYPLTPSPPTSPKYSNSTSTSKCKYTLDDSKPTTDMEYDPLSNYTAGIAVKGKNKLTPDKVVTKAVKTYGATSKAITIQGSSDEEYCAAVKKPHQPSVDPKKYTFSDSDGESSGTEYRPTSLSNVRAKKGNGGSLWEAVVREKKDRTDSVMANALTQRNKEDSTEVDSDVQEVVKQKDNVVEKKKMATGRTSHEKSGKSEKMNKLEKDVNKKPGSKSSGGSGSSSKEKTSGKNLNQENKSHGKKDDRKNTVKVKTSDKGREGQKIKTYEKVKTEKSKDTEKAKTDSVKLGKETENGAKPDSKKPKLSEKDKERELAKYKERQHKNGKLDSSKREKDVKKVSKSSTSSSSSNKGSSANSKDKTKQSISPAKVKKREDKRRSQSLSHADLFGDESPEEVDPIEIDDSESEAEEVLVRKSADALKRRSGNKRKASELTPSSSEDDEEEDEMDGGAVKEDLVGMDFSGFQDDLDFDSDPMEECLRIFNESKDVKREDKGRQAKQPSRDSDEEKGPESLVPGQKKRVSHCLTKESPDGGSQAASRPYKRLSAQEVCYQRMQLAQQQAATLSASVKDSLSSSGERKRIAHRAFPTTSSNRTSPSHVKPASSRVLSPTQTHQSVKAQTTAGILSKTVSTSVQKRVAHTPTLKSSSMKRPIIPVEFGAKIPNVVRQRYLNTFIDECVKFCTSEAIAFQMALDEEKLVYDRSSSKNIYLNVAVNALKKLRSKTTSVPSPIPYNKDRNIVPKKKVLTHEELLGGRHAATTSFTINRSGKQQEEKLMGAGLYRRLLSYMMTEEQLQENGYPRVNPEAPGRATIHNAPEKKPVSDPLNKVCCRCGAEYKINVNGNCVRKEECCFHWGRLRRHKVSGGWETNYSCCASAVGAQGCSVAKQHVQDGRKESLDGYVTTFSKDLPPDGNGGVFALDCEMCYTRLGLELTRVTVIDSELKVIYDTFVKPFGKVVDYNTRFSGVTEEDLENATISLRDVQAVLLSMFSTESILIGHSLESDLLALKLIHSSVVDTAIVFPHRLGLPYKRALRNLMADHLKRIIQDNVDGHDSSEDASACMELMFWKIKEDNKLKR